MKKHHRKKLKRNDFQVGDMLFVFIPEENPLETSEAIPVYETKDFEENVSAFANDFGFEDIF